MRLVKTAVPSAATVLWCLKPQNQRHYEFYINKGNDGIGTKKSLFDRLTYVQDRRASD